MSVENQEVPQSETSEASELCAELDRILLKLKFLRDHLTKPENPETISLAISDVQSSVMLLEDAIKPPIAEMPVE